VRVEAFVVEQLREAEVEQFGLALRDDQDVAGLEVAVRGRP
jgi:hypothetical protein